jgi:RimJ/RimL family protein N-acetyltransferase
MVDRAIVKLLTLPAEPLVGRYVTLEPYAPALRAEVRAALDCDPEAWDLFATSGLGDHFDSWWSTIEQATEAGRRIAYAIRAHADGQIVGTTSFMNLRPHHRCVEIGATFLRPDARSGRVNPDAKRLMLAFAFAHGALRVELVTDLRNTRSIAAITKLGAVREGVMRRDRITWTGHIRDSVLFSVTDLDWDRVRDGLDRRLA